jgi:acetyl esterase
VFDVTRWVHDVAPSRGWDPNRIAVGGQSAGAKLAINVAQQAFESGAFRLVALVSLFGACDISRDDGTSPLKSPLVPRSIQTLVLNTLALDPATRREPLASPYYDRDLANTLARSMDELARRLGAEGAWVTYRQFAKTDHGFTYFGTVEVAREAFELLREHLTTAFASPPNTTRAREQVSVAARQDS